MNFLYDILLLLRKFLFDLDIYDGLKAMKFLEIPPTNETLREYIIPALFKTTQNMSPEKTLEKLSTHTGIPMSNIVPAAMQYLLNEKNMNLAAQFGMIFFKSI